MLGFVGCGNMAQAMLKGILSKGLYAKEDILVSRRNEEALQNIQNEFGVNVTTDNAKVAKQADVLILAVKPFQFETVISEIRNEVSENTLVISIAAGQTIANIEKLFGKTIKLVRSMPNTPALVLEGAAGVCYNDHVSEDDKKTTMEIFSNEVSESMIDTVIGVSGSSPAYVFMFIEAMADAAVADGMPRAQAYEMAAQSVLGSAKMVLETGKHPGELKDMVCSPAGTTIEAVRMLTCMGISLAIGYYLDQLLGTKIWVIIMLVIGILASMRSLLVLTGQYGNNGSKKEETPADQEDIHEGSKKNTP